MVKVLINVPIESELVDRIKVVSPLLDVQRGLEYSFAEKHNDFSHKKEYDLVLADVDIIYGDSPPIDVMKRAPNLKWVHSITAGVDSFLRDTEFRNSPVRLTNSSGVAAVSMAEFVIHDMLMFVKRARWCFELQKEHQWKKSTMNKKIVNPTDDLCSKTIGIVGLGDIGREVARLAKGFNMKVMATRRSTKVISHTKNVDILLPKDQLGKLLSESDFVVLSLALTPETENYIGEKELHMMKGTSYLINVARGNVIDENALIKALEEKWIAGAGLDVFKNEPLPTESELWNMPNVIISPHISAETEEYEARATERFCTNLLRFIEGKPLKHLVNKSRGY